MMHLIMGLKAIQDPSGNIPINLLAEHSLAPPRAGFLIAKSRYEQDLSTA